MFHLHILGALEQNWSIIYDICDDIDDSDYSNKIMSEWFLQYRHHIRVYLLESSIDHPV